MTNPLPDLLYLSHPAEDPDDPRLPTPFAVGVGLLAALVIAGLSSLVGLGEAITYVATLAAVALVCWWCTVPAAVTVAVVAFLVLDGFVLGGLGDLSWDGLADTARLAVLVLAALAVAVERSTAIAYRRDRRHVRAK